LKLASGLFNLMRNLGGAIGIAACGTILNDRTNLHFSRLAEHLTAANPNVVELMNAAASSRGNTAALRQLWSVTYREAQVLTYSDAFLLITLCFVVATLMVPLMRKTGVPKAAPADAH
jgi:DHA2 family multidrug resistance protein